MKFVGKLNFSGLKRRTSQKENELLLLVLGLLAVLTFGTIGYSSIEGWSAFDALYMTVITLSTVGFAETHSLSVEGRAFTIILILMGVGLVMAVLTTLARVIVDEQFHWIFERGGMEQAAKKMNDHTILCGYGRLGRIAVERLAMSKSELLVIDIDPDKVNEATKDGHVAILGDAALDEVLVTAGIDRAARLVSLLPTDPDNLYVILSSKELNPDLYVITRSEEEVGEKRLTRAGANRVLSPYRIGGLKIAEAILRPHVMQFLDLASGSKVDLEIEEIQIPENSPIAGMSLQDAELRFRTNVNVAAVIDKNGEMIFSPGGDTVLNSSDALIVLGRKVDLEKLEDLLVGA